MTVAGGSAQPVGGVRLAHAVSWLLHCDAIVHRSTATSCCSCGCVAVLAAAEPRQKMVRP